MTVKELIEKLSQEDQDKRVVVEAWECQYVVIGEMYLALLVQKETDPDVFMEAETEDLKDEDKSVETFLILSEE